jgi:hypothetical protein
VSVINSVIANLTVGAGPFGVTNETSGNVSVIS